MSEETNRDIEQMLRSKEILLDFCSKLDPKHGKVEFSEGIDENEIDTWEKANGISVPADYREWLKYSKRTVFPLVTMELKPPSEFKIEDDHVIIGTHLNGNIAFLLKKVYGNSMILIEDGERRNYGTTETILRFWVYDMQKATLNDRIKAMQPTIDKETAIRDKNYAIATLPESGVKEALEYFFAATNVSYLYKWCTYPRCPLREEDAKCILVISPPDYDGYYQWQPVKINENIDLSSAETKLGFKVHKDIKELITSYYYFSLEGHTNEYGIRIYGNPPGMDFERSILNGFDKEDYAGNYKFITSGQFYQIGSGCIDGDDSYIFEVDNTTGEVWAVEYMDKKAYKVAESIKDLLLTIKPIWG